MNGENPILVFKIVLIQYTFGYGEKETPL